jgi:DNA helicase-2/ATP-dependent DNA helicase PcrA
MQDTSELQGGLLTRIFPPSACDLRQRFGDSNQAIFDPGQSAATTCQFPAIGYQSVPNSQRFGAAIAAKVHSLAPEPPSPSLAGEGPRHNLSPAVLDPAAMPHTIFLFAPNSAQQVLPAFGSLLLQTFPDEVLRCEAFLARAIGRVGKPDSDQARVPKHVGDYWEAYEPRTAKLDPRPQHLADYVHFAQRRGVATVDCAESVKMVAKGIFELIGIVRAAAIPRGGGTARWLWEALRIDESSLGSLRRLLWEWCIESTPLVEHSWTDKVEELRRALAPIIGTEWNQDAEAFCQWSVDFNSQGPGQEPKGRAALNCYRFSQGGRFVDIEVGTIHSAKGQTHTATLVLETFSWQHDLEDVAPWLLGRKHGALGEGRRRLERLRLVYTAMTRPSHLLCLGMRADAIRQNGAEGQIRQRLEQLGWQVKYLDV